MKQQHQARFMSHTLKTAEKLTYNVLMKHKGIKEEDARRTVQE